MNSWDWITTFIYTCVTCGMLACGQNEAGDLGIQRLTSTCTTADGVCTTLYRFLAPHGVTWREAEAHCLSLGQSLVAARGDAALQRLAGTYRFPLGDNRHVWVAGRRDQDSGWTWVSGQPYDGDALPMYTTNLCGFLENGNVRSRDCTAGTNQALSALCQGQDGVTFWLTTDVFTSWFAAHSACGATGAHLGHVSGGETVAQWLQTVTEGAGVAAIQGSHWVGLRQHPWAWALAHGDLKALVAMETFGFAAGEGGDCCETCVYQDLDIDTTWRDKDCKSASQYFLCDNSTVDSTLFPAVTSTTVTLSIGGGEENYTSVTSVETTTPGATSCGDGGAIYRFTTWILVAMFGIFLLLVLPLVIVCIRRKSQNVSTESKSQVADVTSHEANAHARTNPYYVDVENERDEPYREPGRSAAGLGGEPASDDSHLYHADGARHGGDPETATREGHHYSGLRKNPDQDARDSHEYAGITPDLTPDYDYIEVDKERP